MVQISGIFQGAVDGIENGIKSEISQVENKTKSSLTNGIESVYVAYKNKVIPFTTTVTSAVVGFFQAKGIIKGINSGMKVNQLENENEVQTQTIENLKEEVTELKRSASDNIDRKRAITLKNVGKPQQMQFIVSQMKEVFEDDGIKIPEIPEDCFNMEEYGKFLRESFEAQNVPKDKQDEVYVSLDVYKNNIGKMCRELRIGKPGVIDKTKEMIHRGIKDVGKKIDDTKSKTLYSMKRLVMNALEQGVTKREVEAVSDKSQIRNSRNDMAFEI